VSLGQQESNSVHKNAAPQQKVHFLITIIIFQMSLTITDIKAGAGTLID